MTYAYDVTVCIACRNAESTLQRAIESVVKQIGARVQVLVADGASTDSTLSIIEGFGQRVKVVSRADRGISDAWNKMIPYVEGEWVYFLGADDHLASSQSLRLALANLKKGESLVWYFPINYVDESGSLITRYGNAWDGQKFRRYGMTCCHQGVLQHKSLFELYGRFREDFRLAADYEFLLRYLKDHDGAFSPIADLFCVEMGGLSNDPNNMLCILDEYRLAQKLHATYRLNLTSFRVRLGAHIKRAMIKTIGKGKTEACVVWWRSHAARAR